MPRKTADDTGSAQALDELFRRYSHWLQVTLRRRFGPMVRDPEDLVQETYLRLARSGQARDLRHPQAALMRVAGNLAIDQLRRRASAAQGLAALAVSGASDPILAPTAQEQLAFLKSVILDLPQPFRDTFLLSRFANLTHRQIAEHFGISVKTVEWRVAQALAMCAQRLNG